MYRVNGTMNGKRYVFTLTNNDILCGRGSGPNEHIGNIEFRKLVLTRKAEYNIASTSRDTKGRIANGIIDIVRSKGGRFLRKLSVEQTKEAGYKRGTVVYEMADEVTILEKTKQTLRQNRSEFAAKEVAEWSCNVEDQRRPIYDVGMGAMSQQLTPAAPSPSLLSSSQNQETSSGVSWNPIPLAAAAGMELKDVGLVLTARIINRLKKALSDTSMPNTSSSLSASHATNFTDIDSSASGNASNYTLLSMTTAELYDMGNSMSFLDSTDRTTTSAHVISAILKEYEEWAEMGQFENAHVQEQSIINTHVQAMNHYQSHMQNIPVGLHVAPFLETHQRTAEDLPQHDVPPSTNDHVSSELTLSQSSTMMVKSLLRRMSADDKQTLFCQFHQLQQHQIEAQPLMECQPSQSHQMNQDRSVESNEENEQLYKTTQSTSDRSMKSSISTVYSADCSNDSLLHMSFDTTNCIADNFNTSARSMERSIDSNKLSVLSLLETPDDSSDVGPKRNEEYE